MEHVLSMLDEDLQAYSDMTLHNQELRDVLASQAEVIRDEVNRLHAEVKRALVLHLELRP